MTFTFQLLPSHVIQNVLQFLALPNNSCYEMDKTKLFIPLLAVSHRWRFIAQEQLFAACFMSIRNIPASMVLRICANITKEHPAAQGAVQFARELHLHIQISSIVSSGNATVELANGGQQLLAVRELHVYFEYDDLDKVASGQDVSTSVDNFISMVRQLVPNVCKMFIYHTDNTDEFTTFAIDIVNSLTCQLFDITTLRYYVQGNASPHAAIYPVMATNLSSIRFVWDNNCQYSGSLVRYNCETLTELFITYLHSNDLHNIVVDGKGICSKYPNLRLLTLLTTYTYSEPRHITPKHAVPFPNLQSLTIEGHYPFADDTLFRGNSNTLEYLNFPLDWETLAMLTEAKTFARKKYQRLWYLKFTDVDNFIDLEAYSISHILHFMLGISHAPMVLRIPGVEDKAPIISALCGSKNLQHISILNISGCALSLSEMVCILNCLPALRHLHSSISTCNMPLDNDPRKMLERYMLSTLQPLSKYFARWVVNGFDGLPIANIAHCAIFFAITCPEFANIELAEAANKYVKDAIKEVLEMPAYLAYKQRLSILVRK